MLSDNACVDTGWASEGSFSPRNPSIRRPGHDAEHDQSDRDADGEVLVVQVGVAAEAGAGEHHAEEEQHHHRADVDEHLGDGDELGSQQDVLRGGTGHHDHQRERGVNDVAVGDDTDRGHDHHRGDEPEADVLGDLDTGGKHHYLPFLSAPTSSAGASGTVSIHSPSLSLSCRRSAMRGSLYSYSGLQNRASNGHTSTQIPQYMHSA